MDFCLRILLVVLLLVNISDVEARYYRICYYTNWSQYRSGSVAKFLPEDIDPNLCTHIIYAFAKIQADNLAPYEWNDDNTDWSTGMYEKVMNIKKENKSLKVLLAVGGWTFGSRYFSGMVADPSRRRTFVTSSMKFLRDRGFDGLDIDWEYPTERGGVPQDKQRFTILVQELRRAFNAELLTGDRERLLLTAAVSAGESKINNGYEVAKLSRELDWVGLLSYDLHGSWETKVGHHSALYSHDTSTANKKLTIIWAAEKWLSLGTPKDKLVIGMATYGRSFRLRNSAQTSLGSPATGAGTQGEFTREGGFLSYYEVCKLISSGGTSVESSALQAPYAYKGTQWVGYHNRKSFQVILQYIKSNQLAGAMVWSLDLDDFSGEGCNLGKYPLIKTIFDQLKNEGGTPVIPPPILPAPPPILSAPQPVVPAPPPVVPAPLPVVPAPLVAPAPPPVVTDLPPVITESPPSLPPVVTKPYVPPTGSNPGEYKRVCYFTNWSQYRTSRISKFTASDIDPFLCTHIIYAFARLNSNHELEKMDLNEDYQQVIYAKRENPKLSVLLAVGGWNFGTEGFTRMAETYLTRQHFISSAIAFLRYHGFDGLDLDWEYPSGSDKYRFTSLVTELRAAFNEEILLAGSRRLLLSAAVAAGEDKIDNGYEISKLASYFDWVNLMAYDFHGFWPGRIYYYTGHHSALYSTSPILSRLTTSWAVQKWLSGGMPRNKLVVGMPTYGRTFRLASSASTGLDSLAFGSGQAGPYTNSEGILSYYEICIFLRNGWTEVNSPVVQAPYAYHEYQWVGYHNVNSFENIANWIKTQNLGGAMVWNLDFYDFTGEACGQGRYPLTNAIKNVLDSTTSNNEFVCPRSFGYFADPSDCTSFYVCVHSFHFHKQCFAGTAFNVNSLTCDWINQVASCQT